MLVSTKDILTYPEQCASTTCSGEGFCDKQECDLCLPCLSKQDIHNFKRAWLEQVNKHATRRIFPIPADTQYRNQQNGTSTSPHFGPGGVQLSESNIRMGKWFEGKCNIDINWCN